MKLILTLLLCMPLALFAQVNSKTISNGADLIDSYSDKQKEIMKQLSVKMCDCMHAKNDGKVEINTKNFTKMFIDCLMKRGVKDYTALLKNKNGKTIESKEVGVALGLQMFEDSCQEYIAFSTKIAEETIDEKEDSEVDGAPKEQEGSFVGTLTAINDKDDYIVLSITNNGDVEKKLYLIEDFAGSKIWMTNSKKMIDKNVFVKFKTRSVFMKSFNYFLDVKMLSAIEVIKE